MIKLTKTAAKKPEEYSTYLLLVPSTYQSLLAIAFVTFYRQQAKQTRYICRQPKQNLEPNTLLNECQMIPEVQ